MGRCILADERVLTAAKDAAVPVEGVLYFDGALLGPVVLFHYVAVDLLSESADVRVHLAFVLLFLVDPLEGELEVGVVARQVLVNLT